MRLDLTWYILALDQDGDLLASQRGASLMDLTGLRGDANSHLHSIINSCAPKSLISQDCSLATGIICDIFPAFTSFYGLDLLW